MSRQNYAKNIFSQCFKPSFSFQMKFIKLKKNECEKKL